MIVRIAPLLIGALCVVGNAAAADYKAYHGGKCQYSHTRFAFGLERSSISGVYANADDVVVTCPLVRDRMQSATSLAWVEVEGYSSGNDDYACVLDSQTEDGESGSWIDFDSFQVTVAGRVDEKLEVASTSGATSGNEGTYALGCVLPQGSSLYHYLVAESTASGSVD